MSNIRFFANSQYAINFLQINLMNKGSATLVKFRNEELYFISKKIKFENLNEKEKKAAFNEVIQYITINDNKLLTKKIKYINFSFCLINRFN